MILKMTKKKQLPKQNLTKNDVREIVKEELKKQKAPKDNLPIEDDVRKIINDLESIDNTKNIDEKLEKEIDDILSDVELIEVKDNKEIEETPKKTSPTSKKKRGRGRPKKK